jgi:oligopeptide transport system substrate-binding protein
MSLYTEPPTLDPAKATDVASISVIEQLFIGLVDVEDDTGNIQPELAVTWTISPDGTVYTFTLRSDATWSDGHPVTAGDVRYGMLRTLDPATASAYAYVLYGIKNAEGYHDGTITDTNQVGVVALDDTHLRVTLEYPSSSALSKFALWVARPMPKWAIEAHGADWTEPANIVTSGPYRLSEWVHNDHILLEKNPSYYDATHVQIARVKMWMVDQNTAWTMYLNGQLDTANVPLTATLDAVLQQQVVFQPSGCTYYYGFSVAEAPFDDPLVRKAFAAATNRRGLVNDVMWAGQQPALTFTPPGVFGHVDGYEEGVGIPYNPTQARQWLAQAGHPGGQGLPPVTLWFNASTGHQRIAEYIRDSWYATLGVSVTLQSEEWKTYLADLPKGEFQVWRLAWCADYNDAYNFLYDGVIPYRSNYGNWTNSSYSNLLSQAAREQNPTARRALYKQAEEILAQTDAVMLPLYYYATVVATQPYLQRTFPASGAFDISTWRIMRVQGVVDPATGGSLSSFDSQTTVQIPAGAISGTVIITHTPAYGMPPAANLNGIGHTFDLTAVYSNTRDTAHLLPGTFYTVTVQYSDTEIGPTVEDTLGLFGWDGHAWSQAGITSTVNISDNIVTAQVTHFSLFTVLGETHRLFLPLIMR